MPNESTPAPDPRQTRSLPPNWRSITHGMSYSPEYRTWIRMIVRCENPKACRYDRYGGRGIKVCPRWRESFEAFYEDMGPRPSEKHSIDRYPDNDGDYEPGNCRWATRSQQNRNRSISPFVEYEGKRMSVADLADAVGMDRNVLYSRVAMGWPTVDALSRPVKKAPPPTFLEHAGKRLTIHQWSRELGVSNSLIRHRIAAGWSVADTLTAPPKARRRPQPQIVLEYDGRTMTVAQWSRCVGIQRDTIKHRLRMGWTIEEVLTIRPQRGHNPNRTGSDERA